MQTKEKQKNKGYNFFFQKNSEIENVDSESKIKEVSYNSTKKVTDNSTNKK